MNKLFNNCYDNKTVLITGHTGFKGSWLALWLSSMNAKVVGFSLSPPTLPNHYDLLNLNITSVINDIRNKQALKSVIEKYEPEVIFHLAAQSLVKISYSNPIETLETNIIGTANLFEACIGCTGIKAIINITSDKCYENREWVWGYRESDPMGGYDPYSVSKGCSELITNSFRRSFFNPNDFGKDHQTLIASCRAGNVIGGGDWASDRLVPDIVKSIQTQKTLCIRYPLSTRPWEHILESLSGYLHIGWKLLEGNKEFAEGWNFGPVEGNSITVEEVVKKIKKLWDKFEYVIDNNKNKPHESNSLKLDCSKAMNKLKWCTVWNSEKAIENTIIWYKKYYENNNILSTSQLKEYITDAREKRVEWTTT